MSRLDIGALNVRLQADTRQFVSDMANGERSIGRVANAAKQSRTAIAGLGSAFRLPGLGRAGAFGGAVGNVASAFGLGAFGAGLGGIVGTLSFGALQKAADYLRDNWNAAAETTKKLNESIRLQTEASRDYVKSLEERQLTVDEVIQNALNPEGAKARARQQEIVNQINLIEGELSRLREQRLVASNRFLGNRNDLANVDESIRRATEAAAKLVAEFEALSGNGPSSKLLLGLKVNDLKEAVNPSASKSAAIAEASEARLRDQAKIQSDILDALKELTKENQRQSDQITTSINRVTTQVLVLQRRRER